MSAPGPSPNLRARLTAGERLVGGLLRLPSVELVEMTAVAGFDFVLVDCEHGPPDIVELRHHVTAAEALGLPVLVRPGEQDAGFALRALDVGVQGIVAPHVDTPDEAEGWVQAVRYPPRGRRGFATYSRAGRYGTRSPDEVRSGGDEALLVVMLESPTAVDRVDAIVSVDGVDGYLVGPSDLGASRDPDGPPLTELVARAHGSAPAGTTRFDLVPGAAEARAARQDGAAVVVYNLTAAVVRMLRDLRSDL